MRFAAASEFYPRGSRPARGAWVEIDSARTARTARRSRPARGAWVEICRSQIRKHYGPGRAPQGARGLKFQKPVAEVHIFRSRPARGAWVEICCRCRRHGNSGSRPARGAWVEIFRSLMRGSFCCGRAPQGARGLKFLTLIAAVLRTMSRPARGAWVEIALPVASRA